MAGFMENISDQHGLKAVVLVPSSKTKVLDYQERRKPIKRLLS